MAFFFKNVRFHPKIVLGFILLCIAVIVLNIRRSRRSVIPGNALKSDGDEWKSRMKEWYETERRIKEKGRSSRVPDVIGIGVRKCGTGMLEKFISQHPLVAVNLSEVHYYDDDYEKGIEYYKSRLPNATEDQLIMEKTPRYFVSLPANLPDIIQGDSPNVKLILMLCDPVKRSYSDYAMRVRGGSKRANKSFKDYVNEYLPLVERLITPANVMNDDDPLQFERTQRYLERNRCMFSFGHGIYAYFIKRWLEAFPPERIHIINGEEFIANPGIVLERLQEYLNIPKLILKGDFMRLPVTGLFCLHQWWTDTSDNDSKNTFKNLLCSREGKGITRSKNAKTKPPPEELKRLREFFLPYNKILYSMLNTNFDW